MVKDSRARPGTPTLLQICRAKSALTHLLPESECEATHPELRSVQVLHLQSRTAILVGVLENSLTLNSRQHVSLCCFGRLLPYGGFCHMHVVMLSLGLLPEGEASLHD